jgi:hypothetical protein
MTDIVKTLFGGSSAEQQSTSTPIDMTPEAFKKLREPFSAELIKALQTGGPQYDGPLVAGIGDREKTMLDQLMPQTGAGTSRFGYLENVLKGNYLPGGQNENPFLDAAIRAAQRPTLQGLEETLSRSLPGRFTQAGQFTQPQGSSAFDRAAGIATRGAADAIGDIATKMSAGVYESERDRQQQAVPLSRQEVDATISNLQAQALPRLIEDLGIERGLAMFQQQATQLLDILRLLGGVTAPTVANKGQSTASSESNKGIFQPIGLKFPG